MRVLVVTSDTQGQAPTDICRGVEGELAVFAGIECDAPFCDCHQVLVGLSSKGLTTTVKIVERPEMAPVDLIDLVREHLLRSNAETCRQLGIAEEYPADELGEDVYSHATTLVRAATHWPVGTVLERYFDVEQVEDDDEVASAAEIDPCVIWRPRAEVLS